MTASRTPLTQPVRLATFAVLVQASAWAVVGVLLLCRAADPRDLPRFLLITDLGEPASLAIINLTGALILLWLQIRTILLRRRFAGYVAAAVWIVLGMMAILPLEAEWYEIAVAAGWVFIGATTARWAWRLGRGGARPSP